MIRETISDILKTASEIKTFKERTQYLKGHKDLTPLRTVIEYAYSPKHTFDLPEGTPPFKQQELADDQMGALYTEARRLYIFTKEGMPDLKPFTRESRFIELLEYVHPEDAKLLCAVKDKSLPYKNLTPKLMEAVWPGITDG